MILAASAALGYIRPIRSLAAPSFSTSRVNPEFQLPIVIDLGATALLAVTGALAAMRRGYDLVGLCALAFVSGVGGSLLRDGLFINFGPPVILTDHRYLLAVGAAVLFALLLRTRIERLTHWITQIDAWALGAYAVVGAQKSLAAGLSAPAAVLVGAVNAAGGGILRDILSREEPLVFKPGQFYMLAALIGAATFVALERWLEIPTLQAASITILSTYILRNLAIRFDWRTHAV